MYAIIETGSKQYKVSNGDLIEVERLPGDEKKEVILDHVLFLSTDKEFKIGRPYLDEVSVICEKQGERKGPKTISFKYRRRKSSKKKIGHRQIYTVLKVKEIKVGEGG